MSKPVAWMYRVNNSFNTFSTIEPPDDAYDEGTLIPLYTHPVKELTDEEIRELGRMSRKWQDPYVWLAKRINRPLKDLTNKEIQEVITEHEWYEWTLEQFARAILRKAQEK